MFPSNFPISIYKWLNGCLEQARWAADHSPQLVVLSDIEKLQCNLITIHTWNDVVMINMEWHIWQIRIQIMYGVLRGLNYHIMCMSLKYNKNIQQWTMLLHFKPGTKPGLEKIMIFMKTSKKLDLFYLNQVFFI